MIPVYVTDDAKTYFVLAGEPDGPHDYVVTDVDGFKEIWDSSWVTNRTDTDVLDVNREGVDHEALAALREVVAGGGTVLPYNGAEVGTKMMVFSDICDLDDFVRIIKKMED